MATISLSGRTWVANDTYDGMAIFKSMTTKNWTLDFVCNGVAYTGMEVFATTNTTSGYVKYKNDSTTLSAAGRTAWGASYRTITFPESGNGHTDFDIIWFLHKAGTFTPEIEELKTDKSVFFSYASDVHSSSRRLVVYPYSNDTKEALGGFITDWSSPKDGEVLELPLYKDIVYSLRCTNSALTAGQAPMIDGKALQGFYGAEFAMQNCYRLVGNETLVFEKANAYANAEARWAIGLGEEPENTETTATTITYNGEKIASLTAGQTATIKTAECELEHDIVVTAGNGTGNIVVEFDTFSQTSFMSGSGWGTGNEGYYYAVIPLEIGNYYSVALQNVTTLTRFRVAQADSTEIGTATLSSVGTIDTPKDGSFVTFVATQPYLICYGGTANGGEVSVICMGAEAHEETTPIVITYDGNEIASLTAGQTATIKTANTEVEFDIVVSAKAEIESIIGTWVINDTIADHDITKTDYQERALNIEGSLYCCITQSGTVGNPTACDAKYLFYYPNFGTIISTADKFNYGRAARFLNNQVDTTWGSTYGEVTKDNEYAEYYTILRTITITACDTSQPNYQYWAEWLTANATKQ
jgi:hypothetical protein